MGKDCPFSFYPLAITTTIMHGYVYPSISSLCRPTMVQILIQNTSPLGHTPPSRRATATRKIRITNLIRITMHAVIINIILGMLIRPEGILTIYTIEANVWSGAAAVGELTNVTFAIGGRTVHCVEEAFISIDVEVFLPQHGF